MDQLTVRGPKNPHHLVLGTGQGEHSSSIGEAYGQKRERGSHNFIDRHDKDWEPPNLVLVGRAAEVRVEPPEVTKHNVRSVIVPASEKEKIVSAVERNTWNPARAWRIGGGGYPVVA